MMIAVSGARATTANVAREPPGRLDEPGEPGTERGADEEAGHEGAAGGAGADRARRGEDLQGGQRQQHVPQLRLGAELEVDLHQLADELLTGPHQARLDPDDERNGETHRQGSQPLPAVEHLLGVLGGGERPQEGVPEHHGEETERGIEEQLAGILQPVGERLEDALLADDRSRGDGGRHRGDHHGVEVAHRESAEDHLHGEQHPGDRGVEGGPDGSPGSGGHEATDLVLPEMGPPGHRRAERASDLDDRSLSARRAAGAHGEGRGSDLAEDRSGGQVAAADGERADDLGDTVAPDLGGPVLRHGPGEEEPDGNGDEEDPPAQPGDVLDPLHRLDDDVDGEDEGGGAQTNQHPQEQRQGEERGGASRLGERPQRLFDTRGHDLRTLLRCRPDPADQSAARRSWTRPLASPSTSFHRPLISAPLANIVISRTSML
jgi:hypothetical protein